MWQLLLVTLATFDPKSFHVVDALRFSRHLLLKLFVLVQHVVTPWRVVVLYDVAP